MAHDLAKLKFFGNEQINSNNSMSTVNICKWVKWKMVKIAPFLFNSVNNFLQILMLIVLTY